MNVLSRDVVMEMRAFFHMTMDNLLLLTVTQAFLYQKMGVLQLTLFYPCYLRLLMVAFLYWMIPICILHLTSLVMVIQAI